MIIWSGWGVLTAVLALIGAVAGDQALQPLIAPLSPALPANSGIAIGLLLAALANGLIASRLNGPGRELIDAQTGQRVVLRRRNSLFFIPMRYWTAVLLVLAVGSLFLPKTDTPSNTSAALSSRSAG